ncbi:MAG: AMP-binding protein [Hyphomicrobiaceae bacterium]
MNGSEIYERLSHFAERELAFLVEPGRRCTYRDLVEAIGSICGWFDQAGLKPGDRLAIASNDAFAVSTCAFASLVEGITIVMLPLGDHGKPLGQRLDDTGCKAVLVDSPDGSRLSKADRGPLWRLLSRSSAILFREAVKSCGSRSPRCSSTASSPAIVIFSSGSTGTPKGLRLSTRALLAHLETYRTVLRYEPGMALMNGLPFEHTDGVFHGPLICGWSGLTWIRPPLFSFAGLEAWVELMAREQPHVLVGVPSLYAMMKQLGPSLLDAQLARLKLIVSSAERLAPRLWQSLEERYAPVANIYGMSETVNGGLFALPWENPDRETVGRPIDMEATVRDEMGNAMPDGTAGLLHVRGANLFDGYELSGAFTPAPLVDGWFKTADLAVRRASGDFEILGRADEARNIGGVLVHPREIDDAVASLAYVTSSRTVMLEANGELAEPVPVTFVDTDEPDVVKKLQRDLALLLPPARRPRDIVPNVKLPVTAVGKLDRMALQRFYTDYKAADAALAGSGTIESEIIDVASGVLNAPRDSLSLASSQGSTYGWDSFGHINLALAFERHFGVRMSYSEVTSSTTLADFAAIVRDQCAARSEASNKGRGISPAASTRRKL